MKLAIHSNDLENSQQVKHNLLSCLDDTFTIDQQAPDVVISIGGDGTMLSAFHKYAHLLDTVCFVALHTGHLGFYTDFVSHQIEELLSFLKKFDTTRSVTYPLLEIKYNQTSGKVKTLALNEMTIKTVSGTLVCEVYINGILFEVFRGDGICLSTPTGSTGISKSLGGAVVHPQVNAMQLTEIAPLSNRVYRTIGSSLILPEKDTVTLKIKRAISPVLTIDNLEPKFVDMHAIGDITVRLSQQRVRFKDFKHIDFWSRVEDSFIGEIQREALNVKPSRRQYKFVKSEK